MKIEQSDVEIEVLYRRIKSGRLDLQPEFQRGEVWGKPKKQRLIDSILRGWHIPPVHLIEASSGGKEVLDGQQRLAAIRDFVDDDFPINGKQQPEDALIQSLGGLHFSQLPKDVKEKIEYFTLRVLTVVDYKPDEPGELFFRLNQPTNLTTAEQRNAYFGQARSQIKDISSYMASLKFGREQLGFSNSRMAYDDVLSKVALTLEIGSLNKKITANTVTARYREDEGFSWDLVERIKCALELLQQAALMTSAPLRLNKATFFSWLIFFCRAEGFGVDRSTLAEYMPRFEQSRKGDLGVTALDFDRLPVDLVLEIFSIYADRSSSRVADTTSVMLRDICLWLLYVGTADRDQLRDSRLRKLKQIVRPDYYHGINLDLETYLLDWAKEVDWGSGLW